MARENVNVQMRRTHHDQTWGFRLQGGQDQNLPLTISRVLEGSLADRAGLKDGDRVRTIGNRNVEHSAHNDAQQSILNCGNTLDLIVDRNVSTIFTPEFPQVPGAETKTVQILPSSGDKESSYSFKKSSTYHGTSTSPGYTQSTLMQPVAKPYVPLSPALTTPSPARPVSPGGGYSSSYSKKTTSFYETGGSGAVPRAPQSSVPYTPSPQPIRTLSPVPYVPRSVSPIGRPRSPAMDYLQKTGGLFGIDANLNIPAKDEPSYMKSATLKLIQEETRTGSSPSPLSPHMVPIKHVEPPLPSSESPMSPPVCENCGQRIIGVFCKAGGKTLHGECFNCSTCGSSLKNVGYFLVNEKLYCDLHAKQQKDNLFKATPPIDPNLYASYGSPTIRTVRTTEPVKAPYQPEILKPISEKSLYQSGQDHVETFSSKSAFTSSNVRSVSPMSLQPAGGVSQKISQFSTPGGDAVQMFGPRTPGRAKGILKQLHEGPRVPMCESCHRDIRGPFVLAMNRSWCPDHFVCSTPSCHRPLLEIGFIEHNNGIHCEFCYEKLYAPSCSKCQKSILGDCLTALNKRWHPECFTCVHCHKPFGNASFFLENGQPYCESDWNAQFTTKCNACHFPIEAGDRWVEALGSSFHSDCFCCTVCQKTLEGQSFYAKGGRPYCKAHA